MNWPQASRPRCATAAHTTGRGRAPGRLESRAPAAKAKSSSSGTERLRNSCGRGRGRAAAGVTRAHGPPRARAPDAVTRRDRLGEILFVNKRMLLYSTLRENQASHSSKGVAGAHLAGEGVRDDRDLRARAEVSCGATRARARAGPHEAVRPQGPGRRIKSSYKAVSGDTAIPKLALYAVIQDTITEAERWGGGGGASLTAPRSSRPMRCTAASGTSAETKPAATAPGVSANLRGARVRDRALGGGRGGCCGGAGGKLGVVKLRVGAALTLLPRR